PHADLANITYCLPSTYLDAFAIGACTALPEIRDRLWPSRRLVVLCGGTIGVVVLGQLALGLLRHGRIQADLGFPIALPFQSAWVWGYSLVALTAGSLVLAGARGGQVLACSCVARLGLISYGVYLVHRPIGQLCERLLPIGPVATAVVVLGVSVALAEFSYRNVELPFIRRKRDSLSEQPLPCCNGFDERTDDQGAVAEASQSRN
ncbi:MAG TPA: acyltransferase, partial [Pseudonocardiaceae bacterium]|nr:acyltransferase [Pseudonocardiaceae bacterium]